MKTPISLFCLILLTGSACATAPINSTRLNASVVPSQTRRSAPPSKTQPPSSSDPFARKLANPDAYEFRFGVRSQSVCGDSDDLQHVEDYDGSAGPSPALVAQRSPAVGAMALSAGPDSRKFCSGTLISENLFLTASHCVGSKVTQYFAVFNYQKLKGSDQLREQKHVKIKRVVEDGSYVPGEGGGLDYAILELDGQPGREFGFTRIAPELLKKGRPVFAIQHPRGQAKQVHAGQIEGIREIRGNQYVTYVHMDTHPGSSGSGVLNDKGELVAVHTNGGCRAKRGDNAGMPVSNIIKESKVLQQLLAPPAAAKPIPLRPLPREVNAEPNG